MDCPAHKQGNEAPVIYVNLPPIRFHVNWWEGNLPWFLVCLQCFFAQSRHHRISAESETLTKAPTPKDKACLDHGTCGHGSNPHQNRLKWVVHLSQNGTIGFDPQPCLCEPKCDSHPSGSFAIFKETPVKVSSPRTRRCTVVKIR